MGISRRIFDTSVSKTVAEVTDQLVEFSSDTTGTPTGDAGIIVNRGSSDNVFVGWDESEDKVIAATTTATGSSTGNLTLTAADFECKDLTTTADITINGGDLSFGNGQNATAKVAAVSGTNTAGKSLTIAGGQGTGSGAGGAVIIQVADGGGSGSSANALATAVTIADDKSATFEDNVTVKGDIILDDGGSLKEAGGTAAITFDGSGHVTKIGQDSPSSGQFLKWDGAKWVADTVSGTVAGSVAADDVSTGDAAVTIATSTGNITIDAQAGDADIIFKGTDDSSDITALTLDMSEAGAALFNAAVTVGTDLTVTGGDITYGNGQNATASVTATAHDTAGKNLTITAGGTTAGTTNNIAGGSLTIQGGQGKGTGVGGDINFQVATAGTSGSSPNSFTTAMSISGSSTQKVTIGSGAAIDTYLNFDGNAQDFRIGIDDGTDTLEIGHGVAHGSDTAISINSSGQVATLNLPAAAVAVADDHFVILDGGATGAPKAESVADLVTAIAGTAASTGLSASSGVLSVSDLHPVGVDGSANQLITDDGDGTVTSESNLSFNGSTLAVTGALTTTTTATVGTDLTVTGGDISYGNGQNATLGVAQTGTGTAGRDLTISAGSAPAASGNTNGGDLILQAGAGDGTGTSEIIFKSKVNGTDAVGERMRIDAEGNIVLPDEGQIRFGAVSERLSLKHASDHSYLISTEGQFIFDNQATNTAFKFVLGSDDANTDWRVQNNSNAVLFQIDGTTTSEMTSRVASSSSAGASLTLQTNDGATMASGHRLGVLQFSGAEDSSNTMTVGARIEALTSEAWDAANNDCTLRFYTTSGNASQNEALCLKADGDAQFFYDVQINGGDLSLGNAQNGTFAVNPTAHDTAGKNLTITAGPTTAGTTNNIAGGALTLQGGQGKGSGAGGDIVFQVANAAGSGSSLNSHTTALTISDDQTTTFVENMHVYKAINNGSPSISLGSGTNERFVVQAIYDSGAQTLDKVEFSTAAASGTANKGKFVFDVDGTDICEITDYGLSIASGKAVGTEEITYTDGDSAITIADGGGCTFPQAATFTSGLSNNDQNITNVADIALDSISADGNTIEIKMDDNQAAAFEIKEGSNSYLKIATTDNGEEFTLKTATANAAGGGLTNVAGSVVTNISKVNGLYQTTIQIDLQGLTGDGVAQSAIGENGTANCYIADIDSAKNGYIYKIEMGCVEKPHGSGANRQRNIGLRGNSGSAYTQGADVTSGGTAVNCLQPGGNWDQGMWEHSNKTPASGNALTNGLHGFKLYLTMEATGDPGAYDTGQFIIILYGAKVL